jgi:hypothetical protein
LGKIGFRHSLPPAPFHETIQTVPVFYIANLHWYCSLPYDEDGARHPGKAGWQ